MVISNDGRSDAIGVLRLGLVALLAPAWLLGGMALIWVDRVLLGAGSIAIGLVLLGGGYRLYRAVERSDVVRDERAKEAQYRAGYNAFWSMVLLPSLYIATYMFIPAGIAETVEQWGGLELAWPVGLVLGFAVYLGSVAYYRVNGL